MFILYHLNVRFASESKTDAKNAKGIADLRNGAVGDTSDLSLDRTLFKEDLAFVLYLDEEVDTNADITPLLLQAESLAQQNEWVVTLSEVITALDEELGGPSGNTNNVVNGNTGENHYDMNDIDEDTYYGEEGPAHENYGSHSEMQVARDNEEDISIASLGSSAELKPRRTYKPIQNNVFPQTLGGRVQNGPQVSKDLVNNAVGQKALTALQTASLQLAEESNQYGKDDIRIFECDESTTPTSTINLELKSINNPARRLARRLALYTASNGYQKLNSKGSVKTFLSFISELSNQDGDKDDDIDPVLVALSHCKLVPGMEWYEIIEVVRYLEEKFQNHIDELKVKGHRVLGDGELLSNERMLTACATFPNNWEAEFDLNMQESTRDATSKIGKAVAQMNITEAFVRVNCGAAWDGAGNPLVTAVGDLLRFLQEIEKVIIDRETKTSADIAALQTTLAKKQEVNNSLSAELRDLSAQHTSLLEENVEGKLSAKTLNGDATSDPQSVPASTKRAFMAEKEDMIRKFNAEKSNLVRENQSLRYALTPGADKTALEVKAAADKLHSAEVRLEEANRRIKALQGVPVGHDWYGGSNSKSLIAEEEKSDKTNYAHFSPEKWLEQYKNVMSRSSPASDVPFPPQEHFKIAADKYYDKLPASSSTSVINPHDDEWRVRSHVNVLQPPPLSSRPHKDTTFDHIQANTSPSLMPYRGDQESSPLRTSPPRVLSPDGHSGGVAREFATDQLQFKFHTRLALSGQRNHGEGSHDEAKSMLSANRRRSFMGATTSFQVKKKAVTPVVHADRGFKYT